MLKVNGKVLKWVTSASPDFVVSRLYFAVGQDAVLGADYIDIPGTPSTPVEFNVADLPDLQDAVYSFGVAMVDDAGNEQETQTIAAWTNVPLDLEPPAQATALDIQSL